MACLRLSLLFALAFVSPSHQKDPIVDFCRRWGHQTAQVDGRLYIDGGQVGWSSQSANESNSQLLFSDLESSTSLGMPDQYNNLSKPANVPSVSGGILWADEVNMCFYQFGGEYLPGQSPAEFSLWTYDVILNQWNSTNYTSNAPTLQRVSFGAGTSIQGLGLGFYYGGWLNERTTPGWNSHPIATSNLVQFDFNKGILKNNSGPDSIGRAEGQMIHLPISDSGALIYFGGVEDHYQNGTFVAADMGNIHIFDVASSKWYTQSASGEVPAPRRQFCADVTWAEDKSSYNIYLYGGYGIDESTAFNDVYVLSMPSFNWIRAFPADTNSTGKSGHGGCTANSVNSNQMLVIGGWFPETDACDSPNTQGQHNMNLGYNGEQKALWDKYDPTLSNYSIPTPIISVIGGGPTGGATIKAPSSWNDPDLRIYYTRTASSVARAATRVVPSATDISPPSDKNKLNVGAIAGGVVGGLVVLIVILCLILFCLHRRKKALKKGNHDLDTVTPPPAELPISNPPQEMPATEVRKSIRGRQQLDDNTFTTYSGIEHSENHEHKSPPSPYTHQSFESPSPHSMTAYNTSNGAESTGPISPPYSAYENSWRQSTSVPEQPHISPLSPSYPQQNPGQYYPYAQEQHNQYNPPSPDLTRAHDGARYSGITMQEQQSPTQTLRSSSQTNLDYGQRNIDGGSYGDRVESGRRPVYGRFIEVDHS